MSRGSEALGRKINGAKDLSAVVRSMKALAASSIAQYEQSVESLQDYARTAELALSACLREMGSTAHAPGQSSALTRGAIIFGSDQGVSRPRELPPRPLADPCGSLSTHTAPIVRSFANHLRQWTNRCGSRRAIAATQWRLRLL
jgi:hypothetical protein